MVTTVTSTVPAAWAGVVTVIDDEELTVYDVTNVVSNITAETELKPEPVMVIGLPPRVEPAWVDKPVTCGGVAII